MQILIILSMLKTVLIMIMLYKLSHVFPPLRMIFMSKMIGIALFQYLYLGMVSGRIDVNKLPYVGNLFIMIDSVFLHAISLVTKN